MQQKHSPQPRILPQNDHAKSIVNKHDYVNINVIMVTWVIILNYRYGINSSKTMCTLVECHLS